VTPSTITHKYPGCCHGRLLLLAESLEGYAPS